MQIPTRRERRAANLKIKKKNKIQKLSEYVQDVQENIEVGKEIHADNIKEQKIRETQFDTEKRHDVYVGLYKIYNDHEIEKEVIKKNDEIKYGKKAKKD